MKPAAQYGIKPSSVYDYASFGNVKGNPDVKGIYIVLLMHLHAEYVIRSAKTGKHIEYYGPATALPSIFALDGFRARPPLHCSHSCFHYTMTFHCCSWGSL
jgi:hypothetical protein